MTVADVGADDWAMAPRADRPKRRTFTAEFKAAILAEYDAADRSGRGEILRREGLYTSHIAEWRKAAQAGASGSCRRYVPGRRRPRPSSRGPGRRWT